MPRARGGGGGGGVTAFSLQFWLLNFSNGSHFDKISKHPFMAELPQKILNSEGANITKLGLGALAEKRKFLVNFCKVLKKSFFALFCKNLLAVQTIFFKRNKVLIVYWLALEIKLGDLKKDQNFC